MCIFFLWFKRKTVSKSIITTDKPKQGRVKVKVTLNGRTNAKKENKKLVDVLIKHQQHNLKKGSKKQECI